MRESDPINNTLNMVSDLRDTCKNQLRESLNDEWMDRCIEFIEVGREQQHLKTLERQKQKFNRLLAREKVREGDCTTTLHGGHDGYHSASPNKTIPLKQELEGRTTGLRIYLHPSNKGRREDFI